MISWTFLLLGWSSFASASPRSNSEYSLQSGAPPGFAEAMLDAFGPRIPSTLDTRNAQFENSNARQKRAAYQGSQTTSKTPNGQSQSTTSKSASATSAPAACPSAAPATQKSVCSTGTPYCCSPSDSDGGHTCVNADVGCTQTVICCNNNYGFQICVGSIDFNLNITIVV